MRLPVPNGITNSSQSASPPTVAARQPREAGPRYEKSHLLGYGQIFEAALRYEREQHGLGFRFGADLDSAAREKPSHQGTCNAKLKHSPLTRAGNVQLGEDDDEHEDVVDRQRFREKIRRITQRTFFPNMVLSTTSMPPIVYR